MQMQVRLPRAARPQAAQPEPPPTTTGFGLPQDRQAVNAARRAFVTMKLVFAQAAAEAQGPQASRLQRLVHAAREPVDLLAIQSDLTLALPRQSRYRRGLGREVESRFASLFADLPATTTTTGVRV